MEHEYTRIHTLTTAYTERVLPLEPLRARAHSIDSTRVYKEENKHRLEINLRAI